jgi:hypothetical protein
MDGTKCSSCEQTIEDESGIFCIGKCEGVFHYECVGINKMASTALLKYPRNLKFVCQKCEDFDLVNFMAVLKKFNEFVDGKKVEDKKRDEMIDKLSEKIENMSEKVDNFGKDVGENVKDAVTKLNNSGEGKRKKTFAEIMKCNSDPVVIIKPKEKQTSNITRNEVKQKVNPGDIPITGMKSISNGGIAIQCENQQESDQIKVMVEAKMGEKYEITTPVALKPRIKIIGLSEKPEKEDVMVMLKQNKFIKNCDMKVVSIFEDKHSRFKYNRFNVIIEMDTENFNRVMEERRVIMKWDRCLVVEGLSITKCYNCNGFYHKSDECKSKIACPKCGEEHKEKDCKSESFACVNCKNANEKLGMKLNTNHPAWDKKCEVYKRKMDVARRRIQYSN